MDLKSYIGTDELQNKNYLLFMKQRFDLELLYHSGVEFLLCWAVAVKSMCRM